MKEGVGDGEELEKKERKGKVGRKRRKSERSTTSLYDYDTRSTDDEYSSTDRPERRGGIKLAGIGRPGADFICFRLVVLHCAASFCFPFHVLSFSFLP